MVADVKNGALVLSCGRQILVPCVTGFADAFFWVSQLKAETEQKAKEEHIKAGGIHKVGAGGEVTIPAWRLRQKHPIIETLQKVLEDGNFLHACRTANPCQFEDSASVTSLMTAEATAPNPKKAVNESEQLQAVLAKVQELEDLAGAGNVNKNRIGDAVETKVREILASCGSGVDEWNPGFYRDVISACLAIHEKKGAPWKDAATAALSALLPSFAHIKLHKLRPDNALYVDYETGLTTLHNMMRRAKTQHLDFNLEALQEVLISEAAEGGEGRRRLASVEAQLFFFNLLPEELKKLPDILIWAVRTWPGAIELTDDPKLQELAIQANPSALKYADEAFHKDLYWLQYVCQREPTFNLQLLKGGGEVVDEILLGAQNFNVSSAEYALSRPRQILTITYLEPAEDGEDGCVNLCVTNLGGQELWDRSVNVPVTNAWRNTGGFRDWWRNYTQEAVYDYAIITPEGEEGKMSDEVPLIDFNLPKWAEQLRGVKKTIRANANFSAKMRARKEKKNGQDGQDEGKDGDNNTA